MAFWKCGAAANPQNKMKPFDIPDNGALGMAARGPHALAGGRSGWLMAAGDGAQAFPARRK